jgi:hypothetical protein
MSPVTLPRGEITTYVVELLRAALPFPVGDNTWPEEPHGWQGEPNDENAVFIPWISVGTGTSSNSSGPVSASQADWRANYFLTSAGAAREQTDATADIARLQLLSADRNKVLTTNGTWKLQQIRVTGIGAIQRLGQTKPFYFSQTDVVELWLSRELR